MARRRDIELVKGLAILLVVFGHLVARADPAGVHWYEPLRRAVYSFHMPLFLYLSGLVAVLSGMVLAPRAAWGRVVRRRAGRLLVPFFGLGVLVLVGKLLLRHWMFVDHAPAGVTAGVCGLFWDTAESPAISIWYLFVLFVVSLGVMAALDGRPGRIWVVLAGLGVIYVIPLPAYVYLDRVGKYAVFFGLGVAAGLAGARWERFMDRCWLWFMAVFLVGLVGVACFGAEWPEKLILLPMGVCSMPAIHGLFRFWPAGWERVFVFLGRYSFVIYLLNTVFIGLAKGVLLRFWSWDGAAFLPFACVMMVAGILGPVGVKIVVLRYLPVVDRLTD